MQEREAEGRSTLFFSLKKSAEAAGVQVAVRDCAAAVASAFAMSVLSGCCALCGGRRCSRSRSRTWRVQRRAPRSLFFATSLLAALTELVHDIGVQKLDEEVLVLVRQQVNAQAARSRMMALTVPVPVPVPVS